MVLCENDYSILICDQLTIITIDDSCSLLFGFGEIISGS